MNVKRNVKLAITVLLMLAMVFTGVNPQVKAAVSTNNTATVHVIGSSSEILPNTTVPFDSNATALDVLGKAVNGNLVAPAGQYGVSIESIMGSNVENSHYWSFYINGVFAQLNYDAYKVQPGDILTYKYVDWTNDIENTASIKIEDTTQNKVLLDNSNVSFLDSPTALQFLQVAGYPTEVITGTDNDIQSIAGIAADSTHQWVLYINSVKATLNSVIQPKDQISFKYEAVTPQSGNTSTQSTTTPPSAEKLNQSIETASQFLLNNNLDEWSAVALNKAGKTIPSSYLESVKQDIVSRAGKFHSITDPERYILGILAAGGDPRNISGYNLVESVYNGDVATQGINGVIYALIALDSAKFPISDSAVWTTDKLVNEILKNQQADGRWSLTPNVANPSDADITAMALTALAPYKGQTAVDNSIKSAINFLSKTYQGSTVNSQTTAQIIIALTALGDYDTSSPLFEKNGTSIMSTLLSFQNSDGGFALNSGEASDLMATQQGLMAVEAYQIKGPLYYWQLPTSPPTTTPPPTKPEPNEPSPQQGKILPNTATNSANLVLAGLLLILVGTAFVSFNRKRRA
jgi:LPXTG-motif cell wall-anchored protein